MFIHINNSEKTNYLTLVFDFNCGLSLYKPIKWKNYCVYTQ